MRYLDNTQAIAPKARARCARRLDRRPRRLGRGRTTLALCSLAALRAGGVFAVGGVELDLGAHGRYHTPGYALVSDSTNWTSELFGAVDSVRLRAAPDGTKPIFVGVAGLAVVRRYLHGVRYTTVHGDGNSARHDGTAPTSAPGAVDWTAQSTGTGTGHPDAPLEPRWRRTGSGCGERRRIAVCERTGRLLDRHPAGDAHARCRSGDRRCRASRNLGRVHRDPCHAGRPPAPRKRTHGNDSDVTGGEHMSTGRESRAQWQALGGVVRAQRQE